MISIKSNFSQSCLNTQYLAATEQKLWPEALVLLHGWGSDSRSWQPIQQALNEHCDLILVDLPGFGVNAKCSVGTSEAFIVELLTLLPRRFTLLGWSLGGMLATRMAAQYPDRVAGLMTLATNVQFVANAVWLEAMPAETYQQFCQSFEQASALTLKKFSGLMAKGDRDERSCLKYLRQLSSDSWRQVERDGDTSIRHWANTLQWLGALDNRDSFASLVMPGLHLLGEGDSLVSESIAAAMEDLNPRQEVIVLEDACHALHWSQPELVFNIIEDFLHDAQYAVDKHRVAESFGRAAPKYDSVAEVQRQIGHELLQGLQEGLQGLQEELQGLQEGLQGLSVLQTAADSSAPWLDLGCGTGYFTPLLARQCESVIGLDLAEGMLTFARGKHSSSHRWLCADAEHLPLADNCLAGVFSSLAIQWCSNLPSLFSELRRVVQPGGKVYLATLGPRTLFELKQAWQSVDDYTHVNHFADRQTLEQAINQASFAAFRWREQDIVLSYDELRQLTYELKTLGAHNMNRGQSSGLTSRQRVRLFKEAYEDFRDENGKLLATYEVFYIELTV